MRYILLPFLFVFILISCNSKEKDIEKMKKDLIQYINDDSFKYNEKVVIYKFDILKVDTINRSLCDSNLYFFINQRDIDRFLNLSNSIVLKGKENLLQIQINNLTNTSSKSILNNMEDDKKLIISYGDSIKYINKFIDSMRFEISKKPNNEKVYKLKTLLKLTDYKHGDSTNLLDTSNFYFDKRLNQIKFVDYKYNKQ